jgi:hypothetical protein
MSEQIVPKAEEPTAPVASELDAAQAAEIGGGAENCPVTVQIGTDGANVTITGAGVGEVLINAYEGVVDATSHVIERVIGR